MPERIQRNQRHEKQKGQIENIEDSSSYGSQFISPPVCFEFMGYAFILA
jgi:hypothetical protein